MNKLYENQRTSISYNELNHIFQPILLTIKNGNIVDHDAFVISFGTFLEVMHFHPSSSERWLDVMTTIVNDLYINSYQKYNTLNTFTTLNTSSNTCLWEWWKCFCTENDENITYPIDKKIDHLIDKYDIAELLEMNKLYDMMSDFFDDYIHHDKNYEKYTTLYIDSLIIGIYISLTTLKTLLDIPHPHPNTLEEIDLENSLSSNEKFKRIAKGYIIHLLCNDRLDHMITFSYAKHAVK